MISRPLLTNWDDVDEQQKSDRVQPTKREAGKGGLQDAPVLIFFSKRSGWDTWLSWKSGHACSKTMPVCFRRPMLATMRPATSLLLRPALTRALVCAPAKSRTQLIKELRARTAAPMKICVEALESANGDVEEAMTILRKSGVSAAQKKASRGASEGAVAVAYESGTAAIVEINSETDFVARNELFQALASGVARTALGLAPSDAASPAAAIVLDTTTISSAALADAEPPSTVGEALGVAVSQLGENLVLRRACVLRAPADGGVVASYVHNGYSPSVGRTAAAVVLASAAADQAALQSLGEKLAMHVVAASPAYLERGSVDSAALQRERDILVEQAQSTGKVRTPALARARPCSSPAAAR